jgi:RNA polymerase sigma factor (sigma-70 family)
MYAAFRETASRRTDIKVLMTSLQDDALWRKVHAGSAEAFGVLFDRHASTIKAYCFRRTADAAAAEDLTSIVFLETWRKRRDVEVATGNVLPWLYGVATNVLRNERRARRRYKAALARLPQPQDDRDFADDSADRVDDERRMHEILDVVRRLSRGEQEAFVLCAWQGLSAAEAAQALGVRETTVRTRLFRARARLRTLVGETESPALSQQGANVP